MVVVLLYIIVDFTHMELDIHEISTIVNARNCCNREIREYRSDEDEDFITHFLC